MSMVSKDVVFTSKEHDMLVMHICYHILCQNDPWSGGNKYQGIFSHSSYYLLFSCFLVSCKVLQLFRKEKMINWEDVKRMKKYLQDHIDNKLLVVHKKMKVF
jgi:hypothetical protein